MKLSIASAIFLGSLIVTGAGQASTLIGSTVTVTSYYPSLTLPPIGPPSTAIVGASTPTFPGGSIFSIGSSEINITGDQITYFNLGNVTLGSGFNGFVFDFSNAPVILVATLDPASNVSAQVFDLGPDSVGLTLYGTTTTNSVAIVDLHLQAAPVPEPATWGLMIIAVSAFCATRIWQKMNCHAEQVS